MDIKGDWKKRAVSGLMVLAMALSLLPTSILAAGYAQRYGQRHQKRQL